MLESLGAFKLRGEDEGVEAGFVDEESYVLSTERIDGAAFCSFVLVYMLNNGQLRFLVPQRFRHILCTEHHFACSYSWCGLHRILHS